MRNLDGGEEKIDDRGSRNELRRLAAGIHVRALIAAMVLTAVAWMAK